MPTNVENVLSHFPDAENGFSTTTSGSVSSGATTVGLNSTGGYTNGEPVVLVIDPTDTNLKQTFTGIVDTSGVQITAVVWTAGNNTSHSSGATVVDYATATHIAMISKGIRVEHNQSGKHSAITATSINNSGTLTQTGVATFTAVPVLPASTVTTANIQTGAVTSEKLTATIAVRAYSAGSQTIEVGTEKVALDTENFDTGADFAAPTFTAPQTGYYQVNIGATLANLNAASDQFIIHIYVNGSVWSSSNGYAVTAGDDPHLSHSDLVHATSGQAIEFYVQNASSATESLSGGSNITYMSIYFVGV